MNNGKILQVGDVVFSNTQYHGLQRWVIDRVTPKTATAMYNKMYREPTDGKYKEVGGYASFHLPTPELEAEWALKELIALYTLHVERSTRNPPTSEKMKQIIDILK